MKGIPGDGDTQSSQEHKLGALSTLAASVANEITNPVELVMLNLSRIQEIWRDLQPILARYSRNEPDAKYDWLNYSFLNENLSTLIADTDLAINRVAKIVADLNNFAKQSDIAVREPMQLNTAVENVMRLFKTTYRKSGIDLKVACGNNLPLMEGDLHSVEQIIFNLTLNAIQAIDYEQGRVEIVTGIEKTQGGIFISISDNGQGVDPSICEKIFDPFVRTKQKAGNTGLGLYLTHNLVKAHGGEITFQSQKGKGTTFKVLFPPVFKEKTIKILVVDDDESVRSMLTEALTMNQPYLIDQASNGVEACIKLGLYRPDLLVLDILMPGMNGIEVCRVLKAEHELSDIKVIVVTGFRGQQELKELIEMGITNILYKPVNLPDFLEMVDNMVNVPHI